MENFDTIDKVKNLPNFDLSMTASQKLLMLPTKVNVCLIVALLEKDACASVMLPALTVPLTKKAKINVLLEVMKKLDIPFKLLQELKP